MVKTLAMVFGAVFLLVGILGFIPAATPDHKLLGLFMVGGIRNVIHLLSGAAAIAGALQISGALIGNIPSTLSFWTKPITVTSAYTLPKTRK